MCAFILLQFLYFYLLMAHPTICTNKTFIQCDDCVRIIGIENIFFKDIPLLLVWCTILNQAHVRVHVIKMTLTDRHTHSERDMHPHKCVLTCTPIKLF